MPTPQPNTPQGGDHQTEFPLPTPSQYPNYSLAGPRQRTITDLRSQTQLNGLPTTSTMGRNPTAQSVPTSHMRPGADRNGSATTAMRRTGTSTTNRTNRTQDRERLEKPQTQTVEVDDEYFALNPWYNQQKDKPVFGLASPLPRVVRRGMRKNRGVSHTGSFNDSTNLIRDNIETNDGLDFDKNKELDEDSMQPDTPRAPLDHSRSPQAHRSPAMTRQSTGLSQRPSTKDSNRVLDQSDPQHEGRERAPVNEHGLAYNDERGAPTRHQFGLADGLPPLQELDTHESTESQKEEHEQQERDHQAEQDYYNQYRNPIARLRAQYPQAPAEFIATFVYLFLGLCVNLSVATSGATTGSFETQAWGWGFAVMVGIYLGGGVSGAHLSPTISLSLMIYRGFPWRMALVYIATQMLAGLAAGGLAYALYHDAIHDMDPHLTVELTGKALFPKGPSFSTVSGFFNDFVYMAVWVCITFALGDDQNSPPGQGMSAVVFGFASFLTMVALGYNTGLGISPARDLGPRLVAYWAGYKDAFKTGYWAYGPWGASISGALVGGLVYDLFIFVGGESPVNYRWSYLQEVFGGVTEKKKAVKDRISRMA